MPEDTQNLQEVTTEEEVTTDEGQQQEELQASEKPAENLGLDDNAKERTREQFEKLKQANQELKKELEAAKKPNRSVLESMIPGNQEVRLDQFVPQVQLNNIAPQKVQEIAKELVDSEGYVNAEVLNNRLKQADEAELRAREAERKAQAAMDRVANYEIKQQVKDLHQEFPELDPYSNTFNPEAYDLVQKELLNQLVQTGDQNGLEAARKMSKYFRPQESKPDVKQQAIQGQKQAIISVANSGKSQRSYSNDEFEELKKRSLTDPNAMAERLKRWESGN